MAKGNTFINDLLKLLFNGTPIAGIADNAASGAITSWQLSLHTANPGVGGDQTTSECNYTGYARVAVARTTSGWTVSGQTVNPNSTISFPVSTAGTQTATYAAIGTAASGTGKIAYIGPTGNIAISSGVTPQLTTASAVTES